MCSLTALSSCSFPRAIYWNHGLSREWRYNYSSANRRCSHYIWVCNNFIYYKCASCIGDLTVNSFIYLPMPQSRCWILCKRSPASYMKHVAHYLSKWYISDYSKGLWHIIFRRIVFLAIRCISCSGYSFINQVAFNSRIFWIKPLFALRIIL